jgi:hypothetical protein
MHSLSARTGTGERYATQMGELWSGLALALSRLDRLAAEPSELREEEVAELRRLQYRLHAVAERVYGLAPPAGAVTAHADLWAALTCARDATAEVVEALEEDGPDAAEPFVHEWRGALFRVRLARMRLAGPREAPPAPDPARREISLPLLACVLVGIGGAAFVTGAVSGLWPVWLAGMLAVCGSALAYRP